MASLFPPSPSYLWALGIILDLGTEHTCAPASVQSPWGRDEENAMCEGPWVSGRGG